MKARYIHVWNAKMRPPWTINMLPEPVTLQEGGLQKGGGLSLALGYWVYDVVTEKNFRTHRGRDQECLLVKQSEGKMRR
jgi:hypothetical protein